MYAIRSYYGREIVERAALLEQVALAYRRARG